jgi:hypothetical protein
MSIKSYAMGVLVMVWSTFGFGGTYPDAHLERSEGFIDIDFQIVKFTKQPDGTMRFHAKGRLQGQNVGFAIELLPDWKKSPIEKSDQFFYWGNGRFIRTGEDTDKFVAVVSALYELHPTATHSQKIVEAEVVGLANDPTLARLEPTRMKFFFNTSGGEDAYAEVFINIDPRSNKLQFHEKDPEYRKPLIKSLSTRPH